MTHPSEGFLAELLEKYRSDKPCVDCHADLGTPHATLCEIRRCLITGRQAAVYSLQLLFLLEHYLFDDLKVLMHIDLLQQFLLLVQILLEVLLYSCIALRRRIANV